jgi:hypothetical protein
MPSKPETLKRLQLPEAPKQRLAGEEDCAARGAKSIKKMVSPGFKMGTGRQMALVGKRLACK